MAETSWRINELEYFEAPGLSALVFHNNYPEGKQGGIEIIQHGERVASCGDLRLEPAPGQWAPLPQMLKREVDPERQEARVEMRFPGLDYTVRMRAQGDALRISVDLAQPLPPEWEGKAGFNLELYPPAFFGKTYFLGNKRSLFPRQANGPLGYGKEGQLRLIPLAVGPKLTIAPEDPLVHLEIEACNSLLALYDGRDIAQSGWFVVRSLLPGGASQNAVEWVIRPHAQPGWQRKPVICISQVGYHPHQQKRAVIELDLAAEAFSEATLLRINPDGGAQPVLQARPEPWGRFLRYQYAIFDFTSVREPGMYLIQYGEVSTPPFKIDPYVYRTDVWQPTLETFLPVQMCHMEVRDRYQVWHGACHLDDALQAPLNHEHFDGYRQYAETETPYPPLTHIPHLNRGGWHDAGDYDLAAGSQATTTHVLVLAREAFGVDTDQTTVNQEERTVYLHKPDGIPDIVQQIAHGVENLLSGYRAAGHSFSGIIESTLHPQYVHLGDASTITDNRVYDPTLKPGETSDERSGKMDDRWAFTNRDTALEYQVLAALAAASRALRGYDERLADECLQTAVRAWEREQAGKPVSQPSSYTPRDVEVQEALAAAELLITTGQEQYRQRLTALLPVFEKNIARLGWCAARALPWIQDEAFAGRIRSALQAYKQDLDAELARNPFGVPWRPHIWGIGWSIQGFAVEQYYLVKAFPDLFDRENLLRVLNFVLGCHPASNTSYVSGVGARSLTVAYGTNRADWSYIPGGNASGAALIRPDFPELKEPFPFLWQQAEYVIGGAATYIFCALAADQLLNMT